ncbi:MAG: hypothetical protein IKR47_04105 [Lachnospiraceae bacterium]|nr:hypothetical protein [Lachnospiraceae bacterium]MCR4684950.1 hypothetical protein [Lachnospiraceae bacterium]
MAEYEENREQAEVEVELDPELEALLDTKLYKDKLEMLINMRHRLTEDMIRTICITHDIQLNATDVQEQYEELKAYMSTMKKYETDRLR